MIKTVTNASVDSDHVISVGLEDGTRIKFDAHDERDMGRLIGELRANGRSAVHLSDTDQLIGLRMDQTMLDLMEPTPCLTTPLPTSSATRCAA